MTEPQQWHPILTTSPWFRAAEEDRDRVRKLRDLALEREQQEANQYREALTAHRQKSAEEMARGVLPSDPEPVPPRDGSALVQQLTRELAQKEEALRRNSFDPDSLLPALRSRERELQEHILAVAQELRPALAELAQLNRTAAHAVAVDGGHLPVNPPGSLAALVAWAQGGASVVDAADPFDVESASFEANQKPSRMELDRVLHGSRDPWAARG